MAHCLPCHHEIQLTDEGTGRVVTREYGPSRKEKTRQEGMLVNSQSLAKNRPIGNRDAWIVPEIMGRRRDRLSEQDNCEDKDEDR
jgi:hypothetical protein